MEHSKTMVSEEASIRMVLVLDEFTLPNVTVQSVVDLEHGPISMLPEPMLPLKLI